MRDLPPGWAWATLGEIGEYLNGRGFKKSEWSDAGRPIIRIQNLTGSGSAFNYFDGEPEERYTARPGDILLSWAATLGVFVWRGPEAVVNQHIFKVGSHIDRDFHRYLLEAVLGELRRQTHGSGMVHITRSKFDGTPIAVPPIAEQRRIVAVIEEHFSRLDAAQLRIERVARGVRHLRGRVLAALAPGEPTAPLGGVASLADGPFGSNLKSSHYTERGPRVVRLQNIGDGVFLDGLAHISEAHFAKLASHAVAEGDIVAASLGEGAPRACLIPATLGPALVKADCIRIRPGPDLLPAFLMWFLNSAEAKRLAAGSMRGVGRLRLGVRGLRALPVPVPGLAKQRAIVARIDEQLSRMDMQLATTATVHGRIEALRRSILERAFRGELVPQDPSDEPASVLLERIRAERAAAGPPRRRPSRRTARGGHTTGTSGR